MRALLTKSLLAVIALAIAAAGCSEKLTRQDPVYDEITKELDQAADQRAKARMPEAVEKALLPPLIVQMPRPDGAPVAQRFDLSVNNAPANQVFMAIATGSPYSMIVHPAVRAPISLNVKNVTIFEALETLRDLYGYEYRVQGTRIMIKPVTMQTRIFQVNYLQGRRQGLTQVRVATGSITDSPSAGTAGVTGGVLPGTTGTQGPTSRPTEGAKVTTTTDTSFWADLGKSLTAIVGTAEGRHVIVNSQSGIIVVRAMPAEQRDVEKFLHAMQLVVERQVMLEAKIIEVQLTDGAAAGINWAAFRNGSTRFATGVINSGTRLSREGTISFPTARNEDGTLAAGSDLSGVFSGPVAAALETGVFAAAGGIFGLALQTSNFAALLAFLETQGTLNVLSSPRIATINNQKALLKVGTDDFFVTNVSTTSTTSGVNTTIAPTITVQPFFSGVALDVTPQIDRDDNIILHIHPQVSKVIEKKKNVDLGTLGQFTLPLASSRINETDAIVRVEDGNIVAIGGLMAQVSQTDSGQVPVVGDAPVVGNLFRQKTVSSAKSELVILLKPTIVRGDSEWQKELRETRERFRALQQPSQQPAQQPPPQ
ncbi:MAG: secretin N-terminal domain-containing protein [Betaproteobacteria bacterium]|nr:secretin N-terminal domain-containing protein [Betaproteobacteria bacterium]